MFSDLSTFSSGYLKLFWHLMFSKTLQVLQVFPSVLQKRRKLVFQFGTLYFNLQQLISVNSHSSSAEYSEIGKEKQQNNLFLLWHIFYIVMGKKFHSNGKSTDFKRGIFCKSWLDFKNFVLTNSKICHHNNMKKLPQQM